MGIYIDRDRDRTDVSARINGLEMLCILNP